MPRKKNYVISGGHPPEQASCRASSVGLTEPTASEARSARIDILSIVGPARRNPSGKRGIDLTQWLGHGIDVWVWATLDGLVAGLESGERSIATVVGQGVGMKAFFLFLTDGHQAALPTHPAELVGIHVRQFTEWLEARARQGMYCGSGAETVYSGVKGLMMQLCHMGMIKAAPKSLFPANPFPEAAHGRQEYQPLGGAEQQRLADALKADLAGLHHGRLELSGAQAATVHYLVVAMRSGGNPTPLLEMGRSPLRDGLLPGTMILETRKHRAHKTVRKALRGSEPMSQTVDESAQALRVIPMDAVAVLRRQIAVTEPLVAEAPPNLKDRPWLYRAAKSRTTGVVTCLNSSSLQKNIALLVERHGLLGDDGNPLQLNTMRLRQSLAQRAWRLTEADPIAVAHLLGNTPRVAGTNYSTITDELKGNAARFLGHGMTVILRGDNNAEKNVIPIADGVTESLSNTPTARCKDSLHGYFAPKDGTTHCRKFMLCLFCRSFAVVGELDDLWRLFSYQAFLQAELTHLDHVHGRGPTDSGEVEQLRDLYQRAIAFIDQFTVEKFGRDLTAQAIAKTKAQLHPFWAYEMRKANAARGLGFGDFRSSTTSGRSDGA